jgi:uncharacterized protein YjbI with pentapeptide repeats
MANKEHLNILKQGVKVWNQWRKENPETIPDLSDASLSEANLIGINLGSAHLPNIDFSYTELNGGSLYGTDLANANLTGANLTEADLDYSILTRANLLNAELQFASLVAADLTEANLTNASLTDTALDSANLTKVYLDGANLTRSLLIYTILDGAELDKANVTEAVVNLTKFADLDLSTVTGLDSVRHEGPSTVGIDTLYKSKGRIPDPFLRGCGVPEDFIKYAHSLVTNPIEYYSCFISHSSKDKKFIDRLHADLQAKNIRCWYAPEDLKIGEKFRIRIEESIRIYDKVMIVLSENSIQSAWVEEEVEAALERERQHPGSTVLFPIRLDDAFMTTNQAWAASLRRTRHIGDFSHWKNHDSYQKAFDRLLRDLKSETKAAAK